MFLGLIKQTDNFNQVKLLLCHSQIILIIMIGDKDWRLGIGIEYWGLGLGIWIWDWGLGLRIVDWGLAIKIGD